MELFKDANGFQLEFFYKEASPQSCQNKNDYNSKVFLAKSASDALETYRHGREVKKLKEKILNEKKESQLSFANSIIARQEKKIDDLHKNLDSYKNFIKIFEVLLPDVGNSLDKAVLDKELLAKVKKMIDENVTSNKKLQDYYDEREGKKEIQSNIKSIL